MVHTCVERVGRCVPQGYVAKTMGFFLAEEFGVREGSGEDEGLRECPAQVAVRCTLVPGLTATHRLGPTVSARGGMTKLALLKL